MSDGSFGSFAEHGERRFYRAGCHCDECSAAEYDYQKGRRQQVTQEFPVALEQLPPLGEWARRARCRTVPVSVMFPERGDDARPAKEICRRCPVIDECRAYALAAPTALSGVWGAMSAKERNQARRYGVAS